MTLADLVSDLPAVELAAGATLPATGPSSAALLVVDEGLVVLRSVVPGSARRTIVCHAGTGGLILAPAEGESLSALTDCRLVLISDEARERLLRSQEAGALLVDGLAETLRQKHATIVSMSLLHHVERVRDKLIELARAHGRVGPHGIRLDFPLTHDLLGEMTGSARETVTRALDELQREGFVWRNGRTYSLHVPPESL